MPWTPSRALSFPGDWGVTMGCMVQNPALPPNHIGRGEAGGCSFLLNWRVSFLTSLAAAMTTTPLF